MTSKNMNVVIRPTKYGYEIYNIDTFEYMLLPYDEVRNFHDGLAAVKHKSLWGFINQDGILIIDCIYSEVHDFSEGYAVVIKKFKHPKHNCDVLIYAYVDTFGKYYKNNRYNELGDFKCGRAMVVKAKETNCGCREYLGFIDESMNEVIECQFDPPYHYKSEFNDNIAIVYKSYYNGMYSTNSYHIIDIDGNVVKSKEHFDGEYKNLGNGVFLHMPDTYHVQKQYYRNLLTEGEKTSDYYYCDCISFCGLRRVIRKVLHNNHWNDYKLLWGYINGDNEEIIPCQYQYAEIFIDNIAKVYTLFGAMESTGYNKFVYININGNTLQELPHYYNLNYIGELANIKCGNIIGTIDKRKWNYCRHKGNELYIPNYDIVDIFINDVAIAIKDKKCGLIDIFGTILLEFKYDNLLNDGTFIKTNCLKNSDNFFCSSAVWQNNYGVYGYVDTKGNTIVPCQYDVLSNVKDNIVRGLYNDRFFLIDLKSGIANKYKKHNWLIIKEYSYDKLIDNFNNTFNSALLFLTNTQISILNSLLITDYSYKYLKYLYNIINTYIDSLDIQSIISNYRIVIEYSSSAGGRESDETFEVFLVSENSQSFKKPGDYYPSKTINHGDAYLDELLPYIKNNFYHERRYAHAWTLQCEFEKNNGLEKAKNEIDNLEQTIKDNFIQQYNKKQHIRQLSKYVNNLLNGYLNSLEVKEISKLNKETFEQLVDKKYVRR